MGTRNDEPTVPTRRIESDELRSVEVVTPDGSAEPSVEVKLDMVSAAAGAPLPRPVVRLAC